MEISAFSLGVNGALDLPYHILCSRDKWGRQLTNLLSGPGPHINHACVWESQHDLWGSEMTGR